MIGSLLHGDGPLSQRIDGPPGGPDKGCGAQDRSGTVGDEHSQVTITAFGDSTEPAGGAGGMLFRRESEPGGEVSGILEVADGATGGGHQRGGSEQADAG